MLEPRGISFSGRVEPLVKGDENFRPVALAVGPDGSVFVTDWGSRDYSNHGGGKLWRIKPMGADGKKRNPSLIQNSESLLKPAATNAMNDLGGADPFVRAAAIATLAKTEHRDELLKQCLR